MGSDVLLEWKGRLPSHVWSSLTASLKPRCERRKNRAQLGPLLGHFPAEDPPERALRRRESCSSNDNCLQHYCPDERRRRCLFAAGSDGPRAQSHLSPPLVFEPFRPWQAHRPCQTARHFHRRDTDPGLIRLRMWGVVSYGEHAACSP